MKVGFYTLGCKVNQYETEAMKEKFIAAGFSIAQGDGKTQGDGSFVSQDATHGDGSFVLQDEEAASDIPTADIYVINTCTVTNMADRKSRQFIRRAKKQNPSAVIAVVGCYAQVDPDAVSKIEGVDFVLGTNEKQKIVEIVEKYFAEKSKDENPLEAEAGTFVDVLPRAELSEYKSDGIIKAMESRTRAYIKIQEGCDRFCTYCIIPFARGPVRSRPEDEIVEEARGLISAGFKEIVLTGINTALYGEERRETTANDTKEPSPCVLNDTKEPSPCVLNDTKEPSPCAPPEGVPLRGLLDRLSEIPGDFRIRLSSLEPNVVSAEDVLSIVGAKKLCHHLHLSIQSGSDNILKAMNRRYTREEYLGVVNRLREFDKFFGITTDTIVGFPGESEEDFQDSVNLVKAAKLSRVHVFPYSQRKGTIAAGMENQIASDEKKRRARILSEASDSAMREFCESCIGEIMTGLFEEVHGDYMTGYTDNYIRIYAKKDERLLNNLIKVKLTKTHEDGVFVEII